MDATQVKPTCNQKLEELLHSMLEAATEALRSPAGQALETIPGSLELRPAGRVLEEIDADQATVRGNLAGQFDGQTLRVMLEAAEASTLAGLIAMSPPDVIESNRLQGTLEGEALEAFAEVANVLCSGMDTLLREKLGKDTNLRVKDHGVIHPGSDPEDLLGHDELVAFRFKMKVKEFPESEGLILLEPRTAESWNQGPLQWTEGTGESDVPAAPIRGNLTAYLVDQDILPSLRVSCRRVGLELDRRSRTEVPNPAEHRDGVVLMDIPSNENRRFDWCKRLKRHNPDVKVALFIHHPSRSRVLQGFLAKADAIMGWPITEPELTEKLESLINDDSDGDAGDNDGAGD